MRLALLLALAACKSDPPPATTGSGSAPPAPSRKFGVVAELPGTPALVAGTRTFALHGDDLPAPVGRHLLDDQPLVGGDLHCAAALRGAPVGVEDVGAVAVEGHGSPR
jgi:hypothetical protein